MVGKQLSSKFVFAHLKDTHTHPHTHAYRMRYFLIEFTQTGVGEHASKREWINEWMNVRKEGWKSSPASSQVPSLCFLCVVLLFIHGLSSSRFPSQQTSQVGGVRIFLFMPKTYLNYNLTSAHLFELNIWPEKVCQNIVTIRSEFSIELVYYEWKESKRETHTHFVLFPMLILN